MTFSISSVAICLSAVTLVAGTPIKDSAGAASPLADECVYPADWAPPFTHLYHLRNGATVVFVATQHTRDPADATHQQIRQAFDRYRPNFALVEGVAASKSNVPAYRTFLTGAADRDWQGEAIQETLFTVKLADDRGIKFAGWDFSPDENDAGSIANHFAMADVVGAHLVRARVDPDDIAASGRAVAREIAYAARVQPFGAFDYSAWYRRNYGAAFDPANATPCGGGIAARVAKDETRRRNLNLIELIDRHATPGEVVLVEAGANHWLALQRYLDSIAKDST